MTTIVTDGKIILADVRTTVAPINGHKCEHCDSEGGHYRDNTTKVVSYDEDDVPRLFRGKKVLGWGFGGKHAMIQRIKSAWMPGVDLDQVLRAYSKLSAKDGEAGSTGLLSCQVIVLCEKNITAMFSIDHKGYYQAGEIDKLPFAIGTGADYFRAYLDTFDITMVQCFQMAIHRDKKSSTDMATILDTRDGNKISEFNFKDPIKIVLKIAKKAMKLE